MANRCRIRTSSSCSAFANDCAVTSSIPSPPVLGGRGAGVRGAESLPAYPLTPNPSPPSTGERGEWCSRTLTKECGKRDDFTLFSGANHVAKDFSLRRGRRPCDVAGIAPGRCLGCLSRRLHPRWPDWCLPRRHDDCGQCRRQAYHSSSCHHAGSTTAGGGGAYHAGYTTTGAGGTYHAGSTEGYHYSPSYSGTAYGGVHAGYAYAR